MKCNDSCGSSDFSMSVEGCSLKIRILTLVVNTGNLINERATATFNMPHALIAPTAIMVTYIVIAIFIIGSLRQACASWFFHIYGLMACCCVQISLSFSVFKELKGAGITEKHPALALNGVLPMINTVLLIVDLIAFTFSSREDIMPSPSLNSSRGSSLIELPRTTIQ